MARLIGIITRQPVDISLSIGKPTHVMLATHGWGAAWYEKTKLKIEKGVRSTINQKSNQPVSVSVQTRLFFLHLRQATSGEVSKHNAHPFSYKNYSFAHIGSVNKNTLIQKITAPFNKDFQSEPIDSELYFRLIMQNMKDNKTIDAIKQTVSVVNSNRGANFLLTDGDTLYSYRYGLPMYWTRWNKSEPFSATAPSGIQITSTGLSSNHAYIISSEKLFDSNWTAFDDGELFTVDKNLQYDSIRLVD